MTRDFTFRVPSEIYDQMTAAAKQELCSVSTYVRQAVAARLAERNEKQGGERAA
jgi:predicted HicB family RNase H-like nuclease